MAARARFDKRFWMKALRAAAPVALGAVVACAKSERDASFLPASDLVQNQGFDASNIVDDPSFTDTQSIAVTEVQTFLAHTPYGHPSFLATYSSNGVRADDAIAQASVKYGLNPLVFLTLAEAEGGLVGAASYPPSASRVEYVFGCGCETAGDCDPSLAGFDLQVDCIGGEIQASLASIAANQVTAGGFGPGVASTTLDGQTVTPADASTAALYQQTPDILVGKSGGTWLFWNIWQMYAGALSYGGPQGAGGSGWVGDACDSTSACPYANGICATNYPDGMCTAPCMSASDCPEDPSQPATFCADYQKSGFCLVECDPTSAQPCRTGYACDSVQAFGSASGAANVCISM